MSPGRELRDAIANLSLKTLSLGLERVCRLVVVLASAPVLGQAAFGRFVFASALTSLLALGTDIGLGVWTTRALARDRGDGDAIVLLGASVRALAAIPYAVVVGGIAILAVKGETRAAVALLGVAALANAFVDHVSAILRGYERFAEEAALNGCRALATAMAGLVALVAGRSLVSLCAALVAASLAGCLYGLATLLRFHPLSGLVKRTTRARARELAGVALSQSWPIWIAGLLSLLYFKVDTFFLRFLAGDAELGAYGAAFKLFEGCMILPSIVLSIAFPKLARAHTDARAQRRLERLLAVSLIGLGVAVGAVGFLGARPLVSLLFGAGFGRAVASMRILALGLPLLYLNFGLTHFLLARDLGRATTWLAAMMLAANVALDAALIPRGSGPGAAWATVLSEVALTAASLAVLRMVGPVGRRRRSARGAARTAPKVA